MLNCAAVYCNNNKRKNQDKTFFFLPKNTAAAKVWIAKLNQDRGNLPSKVHIRQADLFR